MQDQLHRMEAALVRVETMLHTLMNVSTEKEKAAKQRRNQYAEAKERREKGKVALPGHHIFKKRDPRWLQKVPALVEAARQTPRGSPATSPGSGTRAPT